jgi:hypothetical protein
METLIIWRLDINKNRKGEWTWGQKYTVEQIVAAIRQLEYLRENYSEHGYRLLMVRTTVEEVDVL